MTMSVARLLCSPPVLTTKAVLHPAVLPGCEEQFDWLLVTIRLKLNNVTPSIETNRRSTNRSRSFNYSLLLKVVISKKE